jgi:hypothetical protein
MQPPPPPGAPNPPHPAYVAPYAPAPAPYPVPAPSTYPGWGPPSGPHHGLLRPTSGFVLGLLSGSMVLLGGLFFLLLWIATPGLKYLGAPGVAFGVAGIVIGILIVAVACVLFVSPEHHVGLGVTLILLSILSLVGFGGFGVGLIFGVVGGALAIAHHPDPSRRTGGYYLVPAPRMCVRCGRAIDFHVRFCPYCGTDLGGANLPVPR